MNREIKFRGMSKEKEGFVYGFYIISDYGEEGDSHVIQTYARYYDDIDPDTVGQFTGLKDKNGKEIYENDICVNKYGLEDYYYVVKWVFAGWQTVTYKKPDAQIRGISDGINQGYMEGSEGLEVVGNVYENPELLREVDNGITD